MYDNGPVEGARTSAGERESHDGITLATMSGVSRTEGPSKNQDDGSHKVKTIREEIKRFGDDTTFHGVRLATDYKVNRYRRLLWFIIVGGMSGYLVYGIVISTQTYFSYPVTSVVKIKHQSSVKFPAVTFCNFNWWRTSKISPELGRAIRAVASEDEEDRVDFSIGSISNMSARLRVVGHQIEDMLVLCKFKGQKCSAANFTQVITDFGLCYSFNENIDSNHTIHQSGSQNSLFMQINLEQDEYLPGLNIAAGIKLMVHPQGQRPLVSELGIAISPGFETFVGLQYTQVFNLKTPYESNCTTEELKYSPRFTVPLCQYEHMADVISNTCGCRDLRFPGDLRECMLSEYSCLRQALADFTSADKSVKCQIPCNLTAYEPRISFAHWPGHLQADDILEDLNMTESDIRTCYRSEFISRKLATKELKKSRLTVS
ncbi:acid-sensing ion channel 4-B-like isoform X2 [Asterias amurensis]|uniref:acid-sensing ion channel 4-B-like isoform X2 n=1 Tax=Asterias amurensis TaxID=7602 RepID=UPI003AB4291F